MKSILLTTINARYIHASLGLRYLFTNMGELKASTRLLEFTLDNRAEDIVESLLAPEVRIIGFGVYIWNVSQTFEVIRMIKVLRPDISIVLGGPEVSYEISDQPIIRLADHVITGQADLAFRELCCEILEGAEASKIISPLPFLLDELVSPYTAYTDKDLAHRVLYVEASRGCPFKCEFCLSSLDKTAVSFDLENFLDNMQLLIDRGARHFKFVDRTFNLKAETSRRILLFFLDQIDKGLFLHFELIPDRLPEPLRDLLPLFPAGSLQFEIGIQSFNPDIQQLISRKQHHQKTCENLTWLRTHTQAHIHADLIFGLPGEDLDSFGTGFDLLYSLRPQEIQVGILKRLRGTPIARHTEVYAMRYMTSPPYRILETRDVSFDTMQRVVRFARYWDLVGNSGRFPATLPLLLSDSPFHSFITFSDWLFANTGQTHRIALPKLFEYLYQFLTTEHQVTDNTVHTALTSDFSHNKLKGRPKFASSSPEAPYSPNGSGAKRQHRHQTDVPESARSA